MSDSTHACCFFPRLRAAVSLAVLCACLTPLSWGTAVGVELPWAEQFRQETAGLQQETPSPVTLRVAWGGGLDRSWRGAIRLVPDEGAAEDCGEILQVSSLSADVDPQLGLRRDRREVGFGQTPPRDFDGFDITLADWHHCRLVIEIEGADGPFSTRLDETVVQFLVRGRQQAIDHDGNRLSVSRVEGDELRVSFGGEGGDVSAVRTAGDVLSVLVEPLLVVRGESSGPRELQVALLRPGDRKAIHSHTHPLEDLPGRDVTAVDGRVLRSSRAVSCEVPVPDREGVYELQLNVLESGGLRWARPLASRRVQFVAVSRRSENPPEAEPWTTLYEFDAGSPRLFDRLRKLSGITAMPSVPLPAVPALDMSSVGALTPKLPGFGRFPGFGGDEEDADVLLPAGSREAGRPMESLFPRFSGPLPGGHGIPAKHPLGMMLQLPVSPSLDNPAWEAVVVPGAVPGRPHLLEIEYPTSEDAAVGVVILEPNELGVVEPVVWASGFDAKKPRYGESPEMGSYQQVFWPRTKTPLVVLVNLSVQEELTVGRLRVLAGPRKLPAAMVATPGVSHKRLLGVLSSPEFSRFGVTAAIDGETGRPVDDWGKFLAAAERMAELLEYQAAAGAMVTVYADGTPLWPSRVHAGGVHWDNGQIATPGRYVSSPDRSNSKDLLELLCRVFGREGLELVPAIECSGPLASLEMLRLRGGSTAVGIECVGADGEPPAGADGGVCYNVLDPRVQDAVEQLVIDLADRVADRAAVRGLALACPHDGWFHLPGVAWGLDDATMARFMSDTGIEMPTAGSGRFAERAELVSGSVKDAWLEWRCGQIAAFHSRLADAVAAHAGTIDLQIVPTTLFSEGPLARRFRPALTAGSGDLGLLREIGFDPQLSTAHPQIVFVRPRTHGGGAELVAASGWRSANHSARLAADLQRAQRRAAVHLEQPRVVGLGEVLRASPFSAGQAVDEAVAMVHAVAVGPESRESVTGPLAGNDLEAIFDGTLLRGGVQASRITAADGLTALPARGMVEVDAVAQPLVVRQAHQSDAVVASVINASPAACTAKLTVSDAGSSAVDAASGELLPVANGMIEVPLGPWELRAVRLVRSAEIASADVVFGEEVHAAVAQRLASLRERRGVLEYPVPMEVLDNPDFELPVVRQRVPGWELVEKKRGSLAAVAGKPEGEEDDKLGAVQFSSPHGLSTLRSNPFAAPTTGRLSVAVWLRIEEGNPQPPLRIAVEGLQGREEFYRFAPVGRGEAAMPLSSEWSQIVLQVDDLPTQGLESLRVRLDLLGPGKVCVDQVRVYDLAFDESQRVQLSKMLALIDHQLSAGDVGGSVIELDGHWPQFLENHIDAEAVAIAAEEVDRQRAAAAEAAQPVERTGMFDRLRQWWQ